jgi:malonate-semialdehyde dehydrogenase (acetylating)/methylmalonate-semialdehyde dehydrogenase
MKRLFQYRPTRNFSTNVKTLKNLINGEWTEVKTNQFYEIHDPSTNKLISRVPETPKDEFNRAVDVAKNAFKSWRNVPVLTRQRYMFDYLRLLREKHVRINLL